MFWAAAPAESSCSICGIYSLGRDFCTTTMIIGARRALVIMVAMSASAGAGSVSRMADARPSSSSIAVIRDSMSNRPRQSELWTRIHILI
jgi:hypothetical protein